MSPPTWTVGQVLAAADVNSWFVPLVAVKTSDQSATSNTALFGDSALFVACAANATYRVHANILYEGGTLNASDLKWQWSFPSGATWTFHYLGVTPGGLTTVGLVGSGATTFASGSVGAGNYRAVEFVGTLVTSSTAANLAFNWAQNTSNGTPTIVHALSFLELQRVT